MSALFDAKLFNAEVFQQYYDRIPNLKLNKLLESGAIRMRPDLANVLSAQTGGNFITTPLLGLIDGRPVNYDGETDIPATSTKTYSQSRVVIGRAKAWTEKDFSYDITGGQDFMANIANQISDYWNAYDQETLINVLTGIFSMTDKEGAKFVEAHTNDITAVANSEGVVGHLDATTLNTTIQKALGDNKHKFSMIIMHSAVATNLENLKILTYAKLNDAEGMQRDVTLATLNGRLVLIDDSMPTEDVAAVTGDNPVPGYTKYTTYVLGNGAIELTDCGAKHPFEMDRDPAKYGGVDVLYTRQRKCFAPYGISFTQAQMAGLSPTDAEIKNGKNWKLVNSNEEDGKVSFINHRAIPIARIISKG